MNLFSKNILAVVYFFAMTIAIVVYSHSLGFFFFQDDFFEINISKATDLKSYFQFFIFRNDVIAYRPVSLQNYFFFSNYFFNLNPIGFRFISLTTLLLSSFLITKVVTKITKSSATGLITAFFWITSSIHFFSITWIAAAYNIIGTFFYLLTSCLILKHIECRSNRYYLLALISFFLTIGSFEFSVIWPLIFSLYSIINKQPLSKTFKKFAPFFIISFIYLIARFLFIKIPEIKEYQLALNYDSLKALIWYVLWSFNIPEEFKKQISHNLFIFNQTFLWQFWQLIFKTTTQTLWIIFTTILIPIYFILRNKNKLSFLIIIFFASWFIIAIFPVLLLPNHTFIMYLTLSSIGIYSLIAYILVSSKKTYLLILSVAIWILSSLTTINFYKVNFWMIEAQKVAKESNSNIKRAFPHVKNNSAILYYLPYSWQIQALANMEFIRAVYNDPSLSIYYNKESLTHDFRQGKITGQVYIYINQ